MRGRFICLIPKSLWYAGCMQYIRQLGLIESLCLLNFLTFLAIWFFDGGLFNSPHGLVYSIDLTLFIPWLLTAIPAIAASVYGLLHLADVHSHDDRTKRLVVCLICLVANAALIAVMTV